MAFAQTSPVGSHIIFLQYIEPGPTPPSSLLYRHFTVVHRRLSSLVNIEMRVPLPTKFQRSLVWNLRTYASCPRLRPALHMCLQWPKLTLLRQHRASVVLGGASRTWPLFASQKLTPQNVTCTSTHEQILARKSNSHSRRTLHSPHCSPYQ